MSPSLNDLLRRISITFQLPDPESSIDEQRLSDGLRSLFYLALVTATFDIQQSLRDSHDDDDSAFSADLVSPPDLTFFAIEEPENHLSPHYLSRIVDVLLDIAGAPCGQVAISSHSASVLRRVEPSSVRHFRTDLESHRSIVSAIELPEDSEDAFKYVKEAVQAYPELYFSRFVILCEGDSEELILPRLSQLYDIPIDRGFISVVPLGGRHVNHFWRLLSSLSIPYITLLDLDRERQGGWSAPQNLNQVV